MDPGKPPLREPDESQGLRPPSQDGAGRKGRGAVGAQESGSEPEDGSVPPFSTAVPRGRYGRLGSVRGRVRVT